MKKLLTFFFLTASTAVLLASAGATEVKEQNLPDYKNCTVFTSNRGELIAGYPNGVATIYRCDGDTSVLEFKNGENEKPFQIIWTQTLKRDSKGSAVKDLHRVYTLKEGIYTLEEYYIDWDEH